MQDGFLSDPDRPRYLEGLPRRSAAGVAVLVGVVLMVLGATSVQRTMRIASQQGVPGTFVVQEVSPVCDDISCRARAGTFTSDDGTIIRTRVHLDHRPSTPVKPGDRIRAFDIGEPTEVFGYGSSDSRPYLWASGLILLGLVIAVLGVTYYWRHRKRRGPGAT